jgi:hypothetical protein
MAQLWHIVAPTRRWCIWIRPDGLSEGSRRALEKIRTQQVEEASAVQSLLFFSTVLGLIDLGAHRRRCNFGLFGRGGGRRYHSVVVILNAVLGTQESKARPPW